MEKQIEILRAKFELFDPFLRHFYLQKYRDKKGRIRPTKSQHEEAIRFIKIFKETYEKTTIQI